MRFSEKLKNRIVVLGTGTCNLTSKKAQTSLLICGEHTNIVYDFGYMVLSKVLELGLSMDEIGDIVISHFHPDHFSDLIPFLHSAIFSKNPRQAPLNIYSGERIEEFFSLVKRLLMVDRVSFLKLHILKDKMGSFEVGEFRFDYMKSCHFSNISLKFVLNGKKISITGDIDFERDDLEFFKGSDYCFFNAGNLEVCKLEEFRELLGIKKLIVLHSYLENISSLYPNTLIAEEFMEFF